ncbi:MAG TPA: hypothetical protein VN442_08350 [Bryobacteraceae bacterium]|nr:hypothetical protein [Bryobacteraceae bacterium]
MDTVTTAAGESRQTLRFGDAAASIEILVRNGKPLCVPHRAYVRRDQPIKWHCDGHWTIRFLNKHTPFPGVLSVSGNGREVHYVHEDGTEISPAPVVTGSAGERFRYAVAVADASGVYLDAACPEIIIDL